MVEWEPAAGDATRIHDANMDMAGRVTFQKTGPDRTVLAIAADIPGLDKSKASHPRRCTASPGRRGRLLLASLFVVVLAIGRCPHRPSIPAAPRL